MMEPFDRQQLELAMASEGGPHISVFLPPPERPLEAQQDAIRVSNFARQAHSKLCQHWMKSTEAEDFLKPLVDLTHDSKFLGARQHGVAIYLSDHEIRIYRTTSPISERMVVAHKFCIRPMLESLTDFTQFFVLTISKKQVKFFAATLDSISEIEAAGLPAGFEETMADVTSDQGAQAHSASTDVIGKQGAVFHGQGGKPDSEKSELAEYFRKVDNAVCAHLRNREGFLIVAGVEHLNAIYEQTNSYDDVAGVIAGNVDHCSPQQLLEQARPIAVDFLRRQRQSAADLIGELRPELTATDSEQLLCAAYDGRIDTLFFDKSATLSGSFYPDTRTLKELHHDPTGEPGDPSRDLIEDAAVEVFRHRGRVYAVSREEMPLDAKMAAILRY